MSTKGSDPNSLARAISELELLEKRLAELIKDAAKTEDMAVPLQEGRTLLRAAIRSLAQALPAPHLAGASADEGAAVSNRRGKGKTDGHSGHAQAPVAAPARTTSRGKGVSKPVTATGSAENKPLPTRSLLARLDAVVPEPMPSPNANNGSATPAAPAAKVRTTEISADDAETRLARLEAEIAGLTEPPPSQPKAVNARPVAPASRVPALDTYPMTARAFESVSDQEESDEDEAEIEIVTSHGRKSVDSPRAVKPASRLVRETPSIREEEAEVDIIQPRTTGTSPQPAGQQASDKLSARLPMPAEKSGQGTKWRLFRG